MSETVCAYEQVTAQARAYFKRCQVDHLLGPKLSAPQSKFVRGLPAFRHPQPRWPRWWHTTHNKFYCYMCKQYCVRAGWHVLRHFIGCGTMYTDPLCSFPNGFVPALSVMHANVPRSILTDLLRPHLRMIPDSVVSEIIVPYITPRTAHAMLWDNHCFPEARTLAHALCRRYPHYFFPDPDRPRYPWRTLVLPLDT